MQKDDVEINVKKEFKIKASTLFNKLQLMRIFLEEVKQSSIPLSHIAGIRQLYDTMKVLYYISHPENPNIPSNQQIKILLDVPNGKDLKDFFDALGSHQEISDEYSRGTANSPSLNEELTNIYQELINFICDHKDLIMKLIRDNSGENVSDSSTQKNESLEFAAKIAAMLNEIESLIKFIQHFVDQSRLVKHTTEFKTNISISTKDKRMLKMMHIYLSLMDALLFLQLIYSNSVSPDKARPAQSSMEMILSCADEDCILNTFWDYLKTNHRSPQAELRLKTIRQKMENFASNYQNLIHSTLKLLPEKRKEYFEIEELDIKKNDPNKKIISNTPKEKPIENTKLTTPNENTEVNHTIPSPSKSKSRPAKRTQESAADKTTPIEVTVALQNKELLSKLERSEIERLRKQKEQELEQQKQIEESNRKIALQKEQEKSSKLNKKNQNIYHKAKTKHRTSTPQIVTNTEDTNSPNHNTQTTKKISILEKPTYDAPFQLSKKSLDTASPSKKKIYPLPNHLDEVENILAQIDGVIEHPEELVTIDALIGGLILAFVSLYVFNQNYQGIYPLTKLNFIDKKEIEYLRHRLLHQCHFISDEAVLGFAKKFLLFNSRIAYFRDNGNLRSQDSLTFNDTELYKELGRNKKRIKENDSVILKQYIELIEKLNRCMKYIENFDQLKLHQPNIYIVISYIFKVNNIAKSFSKEFRNKNPELVYFLSIYRNQVAHQDYTLYDQLFDGNKNIDFEKIFRLVKNSNVLLEIANKINLKDVETQKKNEELEQPQPKTNEIKDPTYFVPYSCDYYTTNPYLFYTNATTYYSNQQAAYQLSPLEKIYSYLTYLLQSQNPEYECRLIVSEIQKLDDYTRQSLMKYAAIKEVMNSLFSNLKKYPEHELMTLIQDNAEILMTAIYETLYPEIQYPGHSNK